MEDPDNTHGSQLEELIEELYNPEPEEEEHE